MLFDRCAGALGPAETGGLSAKDDCRNALSLRRYVAFCAGIFELRFISQDRGGVSVPRRDKRA